MAKSISEGGASAGNVHQLSPKKGSAGRKAADAAKKAEEIMAGNSAPKAPEPPAPKPELGQLPVTAPSFGANEPDAGVFLQEIHGIRSVMGEVEQAKTALKNVKGKLKDRRKLAASKGLVMREVDEAIEALNTEHVDLIAREQRRKLYFEWLGLPLDTQASLPGMAPPTDTESDQARWRKRGDIAGRLAEERKLPEGCPGHCVQAYLEGWDAGHTVFMQGSPLTAGAFNADGSKKTESTAAVSAPPAGLLVLNEGAFAAGTSLDDANLKTLMENRRADFDAAETVTAVFGALRRILKEPGYVDTGEPDVDLTEAEPLTQADREATAAEFA